MGETGPRTHRLWHEALLALIVLALAFLNFGHQSAVFAAGGRVVITAHSICGDPGAIPSAGDHFACHGCRPDAVVVPPQPCAIEPVVFAEAPVVYSAPRTPAPIATIVALPQPRGPPRLS